MVTGIMFKTQHNILFILKTRLLLINQYTNILKVGNVVSNCCPVISDLTNGRAYQDDGIIDRST